MNKIHITREYLDTLSLENARTLQMMLGAQYDEVNGIDATVSIVDNVSMNIEFATRNSQHERAASVY